MYNQTCFKDESSDVDESEVTPKKRKKNGSKKEKKTSKKSKGNKVGKKGQTKKKKGKKTVQTNKCSSPKETCEDGKLVQVDGVLSSTSNKMDVVATDLTQSKSNSGGGAGEIVEEEIFPIISLTLAFSLLFAW